VYDIEQLFQSLRQAQVELAGHNRRRMDAALYSVMTSIDSKRQDILDGNSSDVGDAILGGMKEALIERLLLDDKRIDGIIDGIAAVSRLDDPVGRVKAGWPLPNGLLVEQVTVPLGVAAIIYESRPNVTADAFALAYKAGCAIMLRGSSSARQSNRALVSAIKAGLASGGGIPDAVAIAASESRDDVDIILNARGKIDVVLPRGGRSLIRHVVENARVPVIETGAGNCHIYVEPSYLDSREKILNAADIIENAKLQRPGACNAIETLLVHKDALSSLMPELAKRFAGEAELRCDERSIKAIGSLPRGLVLKPAVEEDWETEFLDYILAVKTVDSLDEAVDHVNRYGTGHSEAILTNDLAASEAFFRKVDAACVYTNASTRFTDGGEFGFGAELGISTQKFHARGPMGPEALTTIKYRISGCGQLRL
jgi:glutamate-5-semialdehyde dehydrogenase